MATDDKVTTLIGGYIKSYMQEHNMEDTHDNRMIATKYILDDLVKEEVISSYTWHGDDIKLIIKH